jgi:asparagine synthase (glutamine-hydrolysing)
MCGIAGVLINPHGPEHAPEQVNGERVCLKDALDRMVTQMQHRGPDDHGSLIHNGQGLQAGLASTRLSIVDLSSAGHQPMQNLATGNSIAYNGEVYNYKELRDELGANAQLWQSNTDTEVILKSYEAWGTQSLPRLRGMFGFGIWDAQRKRLVLARDRYGMKPLYYYATPHVFVFASEVRTLLESGLVPKKLSITGVASYLRFGAIEAPLSIIDGVRCLLPGHYLTVEANGNELQVKDAGFADDILEPGANNTVSSRKEAAHTLRTMLEDSVRAHLVSDVRVAAFLSGGIDSSALVALMSRVAEEPPKTFTVVFKEQDFSEESYARLLAERFGTEHHEIPLSEWSLLQMLPQALDAMDQPTIDGINTYVISKAVSEAGIKVALSGLGGDELFAGYPSFRRARQFRNLSAVPAPIRQAIARAGQAIFGNSVHQRKAWFLLSAGGTPHSTYTISRQLFSWAEVNALIDRDRGNGSFDLDSPQIPLANGGPPDPLNAISVYEIQGYMANMLLRDTDQMSMAHSLEVRVPFVDSTVIPFVLGLPGKWKLDGRRPKPLLLDALGDLLPEAIQRRPKMGFTLPFERWMHSALKPEIDQTFSKSSDLAKLGVPGDFARAVWEKFVSDPRKERWSRPWSLHILKTWCEINGVTL